MQQSHNATKHHDEQLKHHDDNTDPQKNLSIYSPSANDEVVGFDGRVNSGNTDDEFSSSFKEEGSCSSPSFRPVDDIKNSARATTSEVMDGKLNSEKIAANLLHTSKLSKLITKLNTTKNTKEKERTNEIPTPSDNGFKTQFVLTPSSTMDTNNSNNDNEFNPKLDSLSFFIFMKISFSKDKCESKYLEYYQALSQQNSFFMTINDGILMISIACMCLFFSKIYAEEKRIHYKQKFAFIQEKILSSQKTHMIANISHEARNPLHGIIGASTILRNDMEKSRKKIKDDETYSEQPYLELVHDIYNNANLLLNIFSTSLQMTSLEMGNIKLNNEPFNLLDTIESVISVFYNIAHDKNVALYSFVNLLPNQVIGDHVRISQILMNFISNSIKYSSNENRESYVYIKCTTCNENDLKYLANNELLHEKDYTFIKIDVIDNGKGIDKENVNKLFKAFQPLDLKLSSNMDSSSGTIFDQYYQLSISGNNDVSTHTGKESNGTSLLLNNRTGVGLNISKQLIDKMNGTVIVDSEIGKGTTMSVIFPFKIHPTVSSNTFPNLEEFNIYIIDHDLLFLDIITEYFDLFSNIKINTFTSIEHVKETDILKSFIIIYSENIHLEIKQTFKLHSNKILIPIGMRGRTRKYGNMKYIIKPLKFQDLIQALHDTIDKHRKKLDHHLNSPKSIKKNIERMKININTSTNVIEKNVMIVDTSKEEELLNEMFKKRILITDDNVINRKVMEKMVQLIGYSNVECASNGLECFEMYKQGEYSIILLDLLMPVMCGKESVINIREFEKLQGRKRIPIIAITANVWESVDALKEIGFDSVIYKPILIEKLKDEIERFTQ